VRGGVDVRLPFLHEGGTPRGGIIIIIITERGREGGRGEERQRQPGGQRAASVCGESNSSSKRLLNIDVRVGNTDFISLTQYSINID